jgi:trigger factor
MQVTETLNQGLKREYKIAIPASQLRSKVDGKLTELGEKLRIPGFRPGKVPMTLLKQRYEQSVMGEVLEESVQQSSQQLMTERSLRPAGQPKVELVGEFKADADLEFSVAMEVIPEIAPMDFTTVSLERVGVEVPESEVEDSLKRIAKRQRASETAADDYAAKSGDIAVIDFVGSISGVEFEGGKADGHYLELGSGSFIPGFEEQLIGVKKGDKKVVEVTFPAEYGNTDLAGKEAAFTVTVQEVRVLKDVPIDDELAKSLGLTDLAELKKQARERIEREYGAVSRARVKRKLLDVLADNHDFTLPEVLVEAEFGAIWQQIEADMKAGRLDEEDKGKSEDELKKEYRDIAARRVKLGLLLSEVGRQNNIQVPNEELSRALIQEAQRYPGQQQQVIEYYQRSPEALNQLRAPLYEEKVVDYILERAKVAERKVSPEKFAEEGEAELKGRRD